MLFSDIIYPIYFPVFIFVFGRFFLNFLLYKFEKMSPKLELQYLSSLLLVSLNFWILIDYYFAQLYLIANIIRNFSIHIFVLAILFNTIINSEAPYRCHARLLLLAHLFLSQLNFIILLLLSN